MKTERIKRNLYIAILGSDDRPISPQEMLDSILPYCGNDESLAASVVQEVMEEIQFVIHSKPLPDNDDCLPDEAEGNGDVQHDRDEKDVQDQGCHAPSSFECNQKAPPEGKDESIIPFGTNCYSVDNNSDRQPCPYWRLSNHGCAYCDYIEAGSVFNDAEAYLLALKHYGNNEDALEEAAPLCFLWDMVKECGVNIEKDF